MIQVKFNDKAKQVLADTLGLSGSVVVTELPQVGEEHTIYELQETKVADFPRLMTEIDSSNGYPKWGAPTVVVGTEEDVNPDNLVMEAISYGQQNTIGVYVTSTNKLYTCWKEATESGPDVFNQIEQTPVNNIYVFGKRQLAILRDFDYHVTGAEESDILDGTGHFLDGTEFDYNYHRGVIPLVLTDATDKKILLNHSLIGFEEVTSETPLENPVQVNKIDLSLDTYFDEDKDVIFAPQPSRTISTYWIYSNNTWTNVDEIGNYTTNQIFVHTTGDYINRPDRAITLVEMDMDVEEPVVISEVPYKIIDEEHIIFYNVPYNKTLYICTDKSLVSPSNTYVDSFDFEIKLFTSIGNKTYYNFDIETVGGSIKVDGSTE